MDAPSLKKRIIAVAGSAATLDKALRASLASFKKAPKELLAISNEIEDLKLVLESVTSVAYPEQAILALLSKISSSLDRIDHQIDQTKTSISRGADVSGIRKKAVQSREDLRNLRIELLLLVSSSQSQSLSTLVDSIS